MDQVGIFVDWQNLYGSLSATQKKNNSIAFDCNNIRHLTYLFHSFLLPSERLFRIFFYTALPMPSQEIEDFYQNSQRHSATSSYQQFQQYWSTPENPQNPNSSPKAKQDYTYEKAKKFQEDIMRGDYFSLRLGQQRCQNIEANGRPNLVQKQVDMLIGLDISHVSFFKQVDAIMLFSKDTDMVPALQAARTTGMKTIVATIKESGYPDIRIQQHCDSRRSLLLKTIAGEGANHAWDFDKIQRVRADFS